MSEFQEGVPTPTTVVPGSLEDRVAQRRAKLGNETTELFEVPGFEGVFKVELRYVGGKQQHAIATRYEHVRNAYQQALSTASDIVLAATVAFHSIVDEDGTTALAEGVSWKRLAAAADPHLDVDTVKGHVALIRLLDDDGVIQLAGRWRTWMNSRGEKVERQLEADF